MSAAVEGRIAHIDRSGSNRLRITLDRVIIYGMEPHETPARIRVTLGTPSPYPIGTRVLVSARLNGPSAPVEPGGFDFRRLAWFMRLGGIGYAVGPVMRSDQQQEGRLWVAPVRMALADGIRARIPGAEGAFAAAILTGDRSEIDPDALSSLRASNLAHLLAISGLHMGLLTGFVFATIRCGLALIPQIALTYPVKKIGAVAAISAGLAYLLLSGAGIATQRAAVMVIVMFTAILLDRPALTLRAVAVAATIILVMRPESLVEVGFQMSFAATVGLVVGFGLLRRLDWWRSPAKGGHRVLRWAAALFVSSALAGAATAPFSAFHFNQVAQYGLIANLASVPIMGMLVMPSAVIAALVLPFGLEGIPLWVMGQGISAILSISDFVANLEGAVLPIASGGVWVLPLLSFGALWTVLWFGHARWAGLVAVAMALYLWNGHMRPDILIDESGRLLGLHSEEGRRLNKARGSGFAANSWLENDGDLASQAEASSRIDADPKFVQESVGEMDVLFAMDEDLPRRTSCEKKDVVIHKGPRALQGDCLEITLDDLKVRGALAIFEDKDGRRVVGAREAAGQRLWTDSP